MRTLTLCVMLVAVNSYAQTGCDFNSGDGCKCTQFDQSYENSWYSWTPTATKQNGFHHYSGAHAVSPNGHVTLGCHYTGGTRQPDGNFGCNSNPYILGDFTNYEYGATYYSNYFHCTRSSNHVVAYGGTQANAYNAYIVAEGAGAMNEIPNGYNCGYWAPTITWNTTTYPPTPVVWSGTIFPTRWSDWVTVDFVCPYVETTYGSPLVIMWGDTEFGKAFTSKEDGVKFGIESDDNLVQTSWSKPEANVGFLVLPDAKGHVRSLKFGMFGNLTKQVPLISDKLGGRYPQPYKSNGFEALAEYDSNGDGVIDSRDKSWGRLRLWVNQAHDGVYDPDGKPWEVRTLDEVGITSINVRDYEETGDVDKHGNQLKFKGKLTGINAQIYDVFLVQ